MAEDLHPAVTGVLDELAVLDPVAALDAGVAVGWLVGEHGLDRLHQAGLQQFLWYELPFKWLGPVEGRRELVAALARFFDLAGLSRYADLCRSPVTTELLGLWAEDPVAGYDAFHAAHLRSGVVPPDVEVVAWGDLMGPAELAAFWSTAQMLELAVEAGALEPGSRGWTSTQRELAVRHLERPRPEQFGESLRQAVATERLAAWAAQGTGDARSAVVGPVTNALLQDVPTPSGAGRALRPLTWLLLALDRPVTAASNGGLPPRLVREAADRFGWGEPPSRPSEADLPPLAALRSLATSARLLRKVRGRHTVTTAGRTLATRPSELWRRVATAIGDEGGLDGAVGELLDALLVAEERPRYDELVALVRVPLTEEGWHGGVDGRPIGTQPLRAAIDRQLAMRVAVGAIVRRGGRPTEPFRTTTAGRALLSAALRVRATAPRRERR